MKLIVLEDWWPVRFSDSLFYEAGDILLVLGEIPGPLVGHRDFIVSGRHGINRLSVYVQEIWKELPES